MKSVSKRLLESLRDLRDSCSVSVFEDLQVDDTIHEEPCKYSENSDCTIGNFPCRFELGESARCPIFQLKEGKDIDFAETFCFDSEIKDGKVFCRVNGNPCQKLKNINELARNYMGDPSSLYEQGCDIQVHDEKADIRKGKSEEGMTNY